MGEWYLKMWSNGFRHFNIYKIYHLQTTVGELKTRHALHHRNVYFFIKYFRLHYHLHKETVKQTWSNHRQIWLHPQYSASERNHSVEMAVGDSTAITAAFTGIGLKIFRIYSSWYSCGIHFCYGEHTISDLNFILLMNRHPTKGIILPIFWLTL